MTLEMGVHARTIAAFENGGIYSKRPKSQTYPDNYLNIPTVVGETKILNADGSGA